MFLIFVIAFSIYPRSASGVSGLMDFESGPPNGTIIDNQYLQYGVQFSGSATIETVGSGLAHSGTRVLQLCSTHGECASPLGIKFDVPQSHVKLFAGRGYTGGGTVTLKAFDIDGKQIASVNATLNPPGPQSASIPMEIKLAEKRIAFVSFGWIYPFWPTLYLMVDDIQFDDQPTCSSSQPPRIVLSKPVDFSTTQVDHLTLSGNLLTDSPLVEGKIVVTSKTTGETRSFDALDRGLSRTGGSFLISSSGMLFPGQNSVSLTATNCFAQGIRTVSMIYTPISDGTRFIFKGMEIIQSIQNQDNSEFLIAGKHTLVRVYLTLDGPTESIHNVSGILTAFRPTGEPVGWKTQFGQTEGMTHYELLSSGRIGVTVSSTTNNTKALRDNLALSINFRLPAEWVTEGKVHFRFKPLIDGYDLPISCIDTRIYEQESGCDDNSPESNPSVPKSPVPIFYSFFRGPHIKIGLVGMPFYGYDGQLYAPTGAEYDRIISYVENAFPTPDVEFAATTLKSPFDHVPTADEMNAKLALTLMLQGEGWHIDTKDRKMYGVTMDINGLTGRAYFGTRIGSGIYWPETAAHELAHEYEIRHTGFDWVNDNYGNRYCGMSYQDDTGIETKFPFANGTIGEYLRGKEDRYYSYLKFFPYLPYKDLHVDKNHGPYVGYNGLDVDRMILMNSGRSHDLMTYCTNDLAVFSSKWPSAYTYEKLYLEFLAHNVTLPNIYGLPLLSDISSNMAANQTLVAADGNAANASNSKILIMVGILANHTANLQPFYTVEGSEGTPSNQSSTTKIELLDADGNVLLSHPFYPINSTHNDGKNTNSAPPTSLISEAVPLINGTKAIVLKEGDKPLTTRFVSPNTPHVHLVYPNGGDVLASDNLTIKWSANDADGDDLSYTLLYSADNGTSWQTVETDISDSTTIDVSMQNLPGTKEGLFRVLATDGINTSFDDSDSVFTIPPHSPIVRVTSPLDNSTFLSTDAIILSGTASDVQDGVLNDTALEWRSDVEGTIGMGHFTAITGLSPGTHHLTLVAKNSFGQVGASQEITVQIERGPPVSIPGKDVSAFLGQHITLNGSSSRGVAPLNYFWEIDEKPLGSKIQISNSGKTDSSIAFTPDQVGIYKFRLTVLDKNNSSDSNTVNVTVLQSGNSKAFSLSSEIDGKTYTVNGTASTNVDVESFSIYHEQKYLQFNFDRLNAQESKIQIMLPKVLIDGILSVRNPDSGEIIEVHQNSSSTYTEVAFSIPANTSKVEIVASYVVPEFPPATAVGIVTSIIIIGIVIISSRRNWVEKGF